LGEVLELLDGDLKILKQLDSWEAGIVGRYLLQNDEGGLALQILDSLLTRKVIDVALLHDAIMYAGQKGSKPVVRIFKKLVKLNGNQKLGEQVIQAQKVALQAYLDKTTKIQSVFDVLHLLPEEFRLDSAQSQAVWSLFEKASDYKFTVPDCEALAHMAFSFLSKRPTQKQMDLAVENLLMIVARMKLHRLEPTKKLYLTGLKLIQDSKNVAGVNRWQSELKEFVTQGEQVDEQGPDALNAPQVEGRKLDFSSAMQKQLEARMKQRLGPMYTSTDFEPTVQAPSLVESGIENNLSAGITLLDKPQASVDTFGSSNQSVAQELSKVPADNPAKSEIQMKLEASMKKRLGSIFTSTNVEPTVQEPSLVESKIANINSANFPPQASVGTVPPSNQFVALALPKVPADGPKAAAKRAMQMKLEASVKQKLGSEFMSMNGWPTEQGPTTVESKNENSSYTNKPQVNDSAGDRFN
jgi:hypothetical protein